MALIGASLSTRRQLSEDGDRKNCFYQSPETRAMYRKHIHICVEFRAHTYLVRNSAWLDDNFFLLLMYRSGGNTRSTLRGISQYMKDVCSKK